jgi:hypothetical protein
MANFRTSDPLAVLVQHLINDKVLVHWKGYNYHDDTREPEQNVKTKDC